MGGTARANLTFSDIYIYIYAHGNPWKVNCGVCSNRVKLVWPQTSLDIEEELATPLKHFYKATLFNMATTSAWQHTSTSTYFKMATYFTHESLSYFRTSIDRQRYIPTHSALHSSYEDANERNVVSHVSPALYHVLIYYTTNK